MADVVYLWSRSNVTMEGGSRDLGVRLMLWEAVEFVKELKLSMVRVQ